jgi:hypothetical protein
MHFLRRTLPVATVLLVGISSASAQSTASVSGPGKGRSTNLSGKASNSDGSVPFELTRQGEAM